MKNLFILLSALLMLGMGCATRPPRPLPLTPTDIISMTKAGVSDAEIIRRIEDTHAVYRLSSADVVTLRNLGVSEPVVNFMLNTYVRYVRRQQESADYYDGPYYYWPYGVGIYYGYGRPWRRW